MIEKQSIVLIPENIAKVLGIYLSAVQTLFRDGRVLSPFARQWVARLWGEDAMPETLVRVVGDVLHLSQSATRGKGRSGCLAELEEFIAEHKWVVVVDAQLFPKVDFYRLPTRFPLEWVENGELTQSGMERGKFLWKFEWERLRWEDRKKRGVDPIG